MYYNLIYKGNQLTNLLYEIKQAGYEPEITYQACRITLINVCLESKIIFIIKTQDLVPESLDGILDDIQTEEI